MFLDYIIYDLENQSATYNHIVPESQLLLLLLERELLPRDTLILCPNRVRDLTVLRLFEG